MPAGGDELSEMARLRGRLVHVEGLRVEGGGEALDLLGGKGVRAKLRHLADHDLLEEHHGIIVKPGGVRA